MATRGAYFITYRDLMSGRKGDKSFDQEIVELLAEENPILDDIPIVEANDGTSNKTTIRTGLPTASWTQFYEGVQASKGSKQQIRNTAGHLQSKLEIDAELYDLAPDKGAVIMDEVAAHSEAMMNEMADCLFYGRIATEPKKFNGMINFYGEYGADGSTDDTVASHYVWNAKSASQTSTAALRSIFLLGWGQKAMRCFFPKGSASGGLKKGEFKKVDVTNADDTSKTYEAYRQYLHWYLGLDVRDYRYGTRICNIQADEMFDTSGVPDYIEILRRAVARVRSNGVRQVFYMEKLVWEAVQVWLARKTMGNAVTFGDVQARVPPTLFGIPVRTCDALNSNETAVEAAS